MFAFPRHENPANHIVFVESSFASDNSNRTHVYEFGINRFNLQKGFFFFPEKNRLIIESRRVIFINGIISRVSTSADSAG